MKAHPRVGEFERVFAYSHALSFPIRLEVRVRDDTTAGPTAFFSKKSFEMLLRCVRKNQSGAKVKGFTANPLFD